MGDLISIWYLTAQSNKDVGRKLCISRAILLDNYSCYRRCLAFVKTIITMNNNWLRAYGYAQ